MYPEYPFPGLGKTNKYKSFIQCAIQTCLQKNNYDESRCTYLIDMLYECCAELYKREGSGAKNTNTTCCPKESLLRLKMKQRAEEKGGGRKGGGLKSTILDEGN